MPPDEWALDQKNEEGGGARGIRQNYLVSLEARISRHAWHPLFTLSTHQQRDYKEVACNPKALAEPAERAL